jgi:AcrR family transcriptional regulator
VAQTPKLSRIRAAAMKLLEKQGPAGVSMRRVAAESGVTAMAIYHYFPSRKALLEDITNEEFRNFAAQLAGLGNEGTLEQRFQRRLDAFVDFALTRPRVFDYIFTESRTGARRFPDDFEERKSPTFNPLADLCAEAVRSGYFHQGNIWEIALTMAAHIQGMIALYRGGRFAVSENEFRKLCHRSSERVLRGLRKPRH